MGKLLILWAVGVGSVIGGDFFGWSYLLSSGMGSSMLSFFLTMAMYYYMSRGVASLSSIVSRPGGADVFVAEGLGNEFGYLTAALETAKILLCTCAINNGAVSYFQATVNLGDGIGIYISYIALFAIFCWLNLLGAKYSGNFQIFVTIFSLSVLVFYWCSVCSTVDFSANAIGPSSGWFVSGVSGFLLSQPFASWLFLGFEELPLVAKSMADPDDLEVPTMVRLSDLNDLSTHSDTVITELSKIPESQNGTGISNSSVSTTTQEISQLNDAITSSAMLFSFLTIASAGILTMFLGASSDPGAHTLSSAASPLVDGIKGVYGDGSWVVKMLNVLVIIALITPFNAFLLFSAHHLSLLSMNGMLPHWFMDDKFLANALSCMWTSHPSNAPLLEKTSGNHGSMEGSSEKVNGGSSIKHPETPSNAIIFVGVCGSLTLTALTLILGSVDTGSILVSAVLFPAMCSYFLQLESLRSVLNRFTEIDRSKHLSIYEIRLGQALVFLNIFSLVFGCIYLSERLIGVVLATVLTIVLFGVMRNQMNLSLDSHSKPTNYDIK